MERGHRNEIDGLRALAILPVLFYHAGIGPFEGGFAGVDVFFVISGYLITGLILRQQAQARFSLADFYDRRIRRILPALGAMLLAATIAALFLLLPDELAVFGKSLAGATLFYANILYWLRDTAYFAPDSVQNPLLHVWSLSVEEQFYLFWPPLLIALTRFRRALPLVIAGLAAASLALALVYARIDPSASFYLLPARAWQLLLGALLTCGGLPPLRNAALRNAVAIAGVLLIAAAVVLPGGMELYRPFNALGAAFGTAAILYAADGGANIVATALATAPPVFIGRISYSLYLWHWPALVFARFWLDRELTALDIGVILAAVFIVSILSWRYIEQPIRRVRGNWRGIPVSIPIAAAASAVLLVVAAIFVLSHGLPSRVPPDVRAFDAEGAVPLDFRSCSATEIARPACLKGDASATGQAILWGDSHAMSLAPGLDAFAAMRHLRLRSLTRSACPPLPGLNILTPSGSRITPCTGFNRSALNMILAQQDVRLVILEARWEVYINENRIRPTAQAEQVTAQALDNLLQTFAQHHIPVLVIGNVPLFAFTPAQCYGHKRLAGHDPQNCLAQPLTAAMATIGATDDLVAKVVARYPADRLYLPRDVLCDRAQCRAFAAGRVLYADEHHLTAAGAAFVGGALTDSLKGWPK
ncbi:MAG TPA: acyltransferase family protein [Rhizomicrobium sp.]|jgi:peptidoglycan/LPS O-acetylase OafA/YrhL|nr:acyltransferase family protein [Rhizomicrobium sp.]